MYLREVNILSDPNAISDLPPTILYQTVFDAGTFCICYVAS
jgi:hypothetical protein